MHPGTFALNIGIALLLGLIIGLERQLRQHPAGLRTNALVALGAAMFVSLSTLLGDKDSPTRIAAYIVSGLGFLGGGVILRDGLMVKGMNTAATIWCTGAIGTLAGCGFLPYAAIATGAVLFVNITLRPIVRRLEARRPMAVNVETSYQIRVTCQSEQEAVVRGILLRHVGSHPRMSLQGLAAEDMEKGQTAVVADIYASERNDRFMEDLVARVSIEPQITAVSWKRARSET
jgi:putative Mg2+ transporter-C (MgtC) family protein